MTSDYNPYLPPAEDLPPPDLVPLRGLNLNLASTSQRFVTLLVDQTVMYLLMAVFFAIEFAQEDSRQVSGWGALTWAILIGYYIVLEATTGRTVGKLVAGTKVVNAEGGVPTFGQIVGRSFARLVPFEPLSFVFSNVGWHDRWSSTRVVRVRGVKH